MNLVECEAGRRGASTPPPALATAPIKEARVATPQSICSVSGCNRPANARGWCKRHWRKWRRHGDPTATARPELEMSVAERFWMKVNKEGPLPVGRERLGRCWLWLGTGDVYGSFWLDGRFGAAHRWAYEQAYGMIAVGLEVDHLCRCPRCVNPAHLEAVTPLENNYRSRPWLLENHCQKGHPYDLFNTYIDRRGWRHCRACHTEAERVRRSAAHEPQESS